MQGSFTHKAMDRMAIMHTSWAPCEKLLYMSLQQFELELNTMCKPLSQACLRRIHLTEH